MVNEINKENLNIPDGFGTVLASKLKHGQIKERIAGIDLFDELCKLSLKTKSKIFIYGAKEENLVIICGHYEGIDERVLEETVTDYVSIGDYVLTGGELAALILTLMRVAPFGRW